MPQCQIQWINSKGVKTPDTNDAIGTVYVRAHDFRLLDGTHISYPQSDTFYICAEHAKRLGAKGMENWVFTPLPKEEEDYATSL